jgi:uncharacterized protein
MLIDLQTLSEGPRSFDLVGSAEELDLLDIEMTLHGAVRASCVATLTGGTLMVEGLVFFQATMECCRCLEEFPVHSAISFKRLFQKRTQDQRRDADEEIEWIARDALSVDMKPTIREVVILETPMKPLCSEGCIGLCPRCGHNLNEGPCGCHTEEVDPRWEPLRKLLNV